MADTGMDFVGFVIHFIDANYKLQTLLIALLQIKGDKTGRNYAETILPVLERYGIQATNIG